MIRRWQRDQTASVVPPGKSLRQNKGVPTKLVL